MGQFSTAAPVMSLFCGATDFMFSIADRCFSLWKLLTAERSHLATLIVPLLLHCLTLSSGAGILWHLVEDDFSCDDWKARFGAGRGIFI